MAAARYWTGEAPYQCDLCEEVITTQFVDGRLTRGSWANMCPRCYDTHGVGMGLGSGQQYTRQPDGRWRKTGG